MNSLLEEAGGAIARLRQARPLVHCLTNPVTAALVAGAVLALGGLPVMATAPREIVELLPSVRAVVINLGILDRRRARTAVWLAAAAGARGIPVVLDPVGAATLTTRRKLARRLLQARQVAVLRGNAAEIAALAGAGEVPAVGVDTLGEVPGLEGHAASLSLRSGATVVATGSRDLVTDGSRVALVDNGHPMLARVSGLGCALSGLTACLRAVENDCFTAAVAGAVVAGLAGQHAAGNSPGPGTVVPAFLDALYRVEPIDIMTGGKVSCRTFRST